MGNERQLDASLRLTRWLQARSAIATRHVIGHAESLSSPFHHESVKAVARPDPRRLRREGDAPLPPHARRLMDDTIRHVLTAYRTWAVVGASPDPFRDSHSHRRSCSSARACDVVRVNPNWPEAYPSLEAAAAEHEIDVVDVFRRSAEAGAHVDEAIAIGAKAVWLQLGVIDEAACERARAAGLEVVMDRCPRLELPQL